MNMCWTATYSARCRIWKSRTRIMCCFLCLLPIGVCELPSETINPNVIGKRKLLLPHLTDAAV